MTNKETRSDLTADSLTSDECSHSGPALRERAEEIARGKAAQTLPDGAELSSEETRRLLHELQVHQIELELQNEELRRAQRELEVARARYFDLYDLAPVGYCTLSEAGLIQEANLTAAILLGVSRGSLVKQPLTRFILKEHQDIYYQHRKRLFETGVAQVCELQMLRQDGERLASERKDGVPFWARLQAALAQDTEGAPVCRVVMSDITARKQAEADQLDLERQLLHAQKQESLGVLAGGIAHDFNNLLLAVQGNLELALDKLSPASPACLSIEQAVHAANRATDLARQMLAYSGRGKFIVTQLDLSALVQENAHLLQAAILKTVQINLRLASDLPPIQADAAQMQQIVMNLITNAAESLGEQPGAIALATGVQDYDATTLAHSRLSELPSPGRFVYLEVTDTGCGMDDETQQRLFDPFFTTKRAGRGLGMSAVMGIVRGHQGALFVQSAVGRGTTIRVALPAAAANAAAATPEVILPALVHGPAQAALSPMGRTVLVVDDEEMLRDVCQEMLSAFGYSVLTAEDGIAGVAVFREHAAEIACVLLDLSMPRMDGLTALRHMREIAPEVKVILTSGFDEQEALQKFSGEGAVGFIQKPYRLKNLRDSLARILPTGAQE